MFWTITNRDGQQTLSVIGEDFEKVVPFGHPNFNGLVDYLMNHPEHDEDYVRGLVDPTVGIGKRLQAEFGNRVTFDLHHVFLDGQKVEGTLARLGEVIKTNLLAGGEDWVRFVRFLVNLDNNPSKRAKEAVWKWIEANGLTVTEDGRFLGYKAVLDNGLSSSSGPMNYVNGVLLNEGKRCQVPHEVGSVISKKRADVDDTPGGGCSVGLHVGTEAYARGFAPRLMTVAIDPADVVSVPDSNLEWKIRVCRYEVISLADPKQFESLSYDLHQDESDDEDAAGGEWKVVEHDGLGTTVLETFDSEEAAEEAYASWVESNPEGDFDVVGPALDAIEEPEDRIPGTTTPKPEEEPADQDDASDPLVEDSMASGKVEPSKDLTLAENAALVEDLRTDLHNPSLGHKPLARKWAHLTTEASVRRYRKSQGIKTSFGAKVKDAVS